MNIKSLITTGIIALMPQMIMAQGNSSFSQYKAKRQQKFDNYKEQRRKEFEEYRRKRNEEFASFIRNKWGYFASKPMTPKPKDETVPPIVIPKDNIPPVNPNPKPISFEDVTPAPKPKPHPEPINPIEEVPVTTVQPSVSFRFFGTTDKARFDKKNCIRLSSLEENSIADAWLAMSEETYTNLIHDCLSLRKKYELCDWAYLMMLRNVAETIYGKTTNEAVLLTAYLYC